MKNRYPLFFLEFGGFRGAQNHTDKNTKYKII